MNVEKLKEAEEYRIKAQKMLKVCWFVGWWWVVVFWGGGSGTDG